ncbi:DUF6279 family lipoprotein [Aromatoleum sp.]|uniref:DUF6279 family lipoprotein n=1 Tax=Aromatoleum sp. TaxID=2307007 RepID=UPI002FCBBA5E
MRSHRPTVLLLISALCCVVLVATGCSMPTLAYRNAPTLISWRAGSYFDLDPAQRAEFEQRLERVHAWHRREELPRVIATLREARRRTDGEVSLADAKWLVGAVEDHYRKAAARTVDESADLIPTLRPEQFATLERKLADVDEEFVEEWIDASPEEIRDARIERATKRAEEWLGRLDPAQRTWLRSRLDEIPIDYRAARADRLRRQAEFLALLRGDATATRTRMDSTAVVAPLKRWVVDWDHGRSPGELARVARLIRDYSALYVELINGATQEQRDHLRGQVDAYIDALSKQMP